MTIPISVQIEALFHQWIGSLRDYSKASGEWRNNIKDDLWDIYINILELGDAKDMMLLSNYYFYWFSAWCMT